MAQCKAAKSTRDQAIAYDKLNFEFLSRVRRPSTTFNRTHLVKEPEDDEGHHVP